MENKPFIFGVATSGDNFTDREKETERLLLNFRHGINTVLISPRRWGKTSLVQKVCRLAQSDKLKVVYLDIFRVVAIGIFMMHLLLLFSNKHPRS
jgi:AAA+ ATPase superfamily predicted ATPase